MRFLVDANLSPRVATKLSEAGHDAVHVFERDLGEATDHAILEAAGTDDRVTSRATPTSVRSLPVTIATSRRSSCSDTSTS